MQISFAEMEFQPKFVWLQSQYFFYYAMLFASLLEVSLKRNGVRWNFSKKKAKCMPVDQTRRAAVGHDMGCQLGFLLRAKLQNLRPHSTLRISILTRSIHLRLKPKSNWVMGAHESPFCFCQFALDFSTPSWALNDTQALQKCSGNQRLLLIFEW